MYALIDCNNFFVSCERVFDPKLRGVPVVVLSSNDGCIVSRSEETKGLGVPMGVPYFKWKDFLKEYKVKAFSSNFELYSDMSQRVMEVLSTFSPDLEVYSVDEAFIYLGQRTKDLEFREWGRKVKEAIVRSTGIPVTVGIAPTKTLAKVAAGVGKKGGGVYVLADRESGEEVLKNLQVGEVWGIGGRTSLKLQKEGIDTALKLAAASEHWVQKNFGIGVLRISAELRGISCSGVHGKDDHKKSIRSTHSFPRPITRKHDLEAAIAGHVERAARKLRAQGDEAGYISVFASSGRHDPRRVYSSTYCVLSEPTSDTFELTRVALSLVEKMFEGGARYKRAGVLLSNFSPLGTQFSLFEDRQEAMRRQRLMNVVDKLSRKYGKGIVMSAVRARDVRWMPRHDFSSSRFTTSWKELPQVRA